MPTLLLHTIALEPNRWQAEKPPAYLLRELLAPIAGAGFHFVELWQNHFARATHAEIRGISQQAGDLGLSFPVAGIYPSLDLSGGEWDRHMKEMEEILDRALLLGSSTVKIFVGRKDRSQLGQPEYETSVRSLIHLTRIASARMMVVAGEIHENTLFSSVASATEVLRDVGDQHFRICFQPLDFTSTDATLSAYDALREYVVHLHLQGRRGGTLCLLEEAEIDYGRIVKRLSDRKYDGTMSIEFVKDCVVSDRKEFDLNNVVTNAIRDRDYVMTLGRGAGLDIRV